MSGFDKMKQLTRRAAREGARVVVGGHTEVPFAARGEAPWREMELLVESGFSPLEAISAATTTAAAFLFRGDQLGSVRRGFNADLVVLRGQPDRDISAIRTVERVMVAGRWIDTPDTGAIDAGWAQIADVRSRSPGRGKVPGARIDTARDRGRLTEHFELATKTSVVSAPDIRPWPIPSKSTTRSSWRRSSPNRRLPIWTAPDAWTATS